MRLKQPLQQRLLWQRSWRRRRRLPAT